MPGNTPNRGFPYPLGVDPIDIAGDIRRLAEDVDLDVFALFNADAAESAARAAADTNLNTRVTNEHNAWVQRDNELINDYIARDVAVTNGYRADDGHYAVTAWSHNAYRNDKILLQAAYGEYTCDGFSSFVVGLPVAYPNRYYTPIVTRASTAAHHITAMDAAYREAGSFRVFAQRSTDGASLAGTPVAVWWVTIGVAI